MRLRLQKGFWTSTFGLGLLGFVALSVAVAAGIFTFYYVKYSRMIDARLSGHILQNTTQIFSAPEPISDGQAWGPEDLIMYLQRAGYRPEADEWALGEYLVNGTTVDIKPSKLSYFGGANALAVQFNGKVIRSIRPLSGGSDMGMAEIEPQLITNLFDSSREKRRLVRYEDLPQVLVQAILSAEDKRFFEHPGFDFIRIFGAAWADIRHSQHMQGASTITMQVARTYFLTTDRTWKRKLAEAMLSFELEQRFSKQRIFEMYANEVYLGNRGSFGIRGFAEASVAYFGKDLRQLTLPECAFLAGLIRAPNYYSVSDRHPERAVQARDRVLTQMYENRYITESDLRDGKNTTLKLVRTSVTGNEAPYFVDMVKDHLLQNYTDQDLLSSNYRVYTTLDPQLQRAAAIAVEAGMKNVDALLDKKYEKIRKLHPPKKGAPEPPPPPQAQVALVALDPRTGEIKALIGGRDYGQSQLNHALAHRQPGSVFKPFVYAAAFNNAVDGAQPLVTPATTVDDEPTVFEFDGQEYTPNNYGERFMGKVTVRQALTNSLNVATVKVAEMVGYGRVVQIARQMGLGTNIKPTPAVALGAYELTPVEVAGAYTAFATLGTRAEPMYVKSIVGASGNVLERNSPVNKMALDPRVAYLVDSILKDVLNKGTGAQVRAKGFTLPAAGKTGTSRDGWFAGFTNNLVCVIWIGFDDNRDLGLTGGATAGPIWADFMIRATSLPGYRDVKDLDKPEGVDSILIDSDTLEVATPSCPDTREEVYIAGSEPTQLCELHGGHPATSAGSFLSHIFGGGTKPPQPPNGPEGAPGQPGLNNPSANPADAADPAAVNENEKKKGLIQKIFGIFGDKDKEKRARQTCSRQRRLAMSTFPLAVPAASFAVFLVAFSSFAQTAPPSTKPPQSSAITTDENQKLPDEEMARLYLVRKQYREAQDIFHKLTVEHPNNALYWNELGISMHNQMDLSGALKCYQKSAKLDKHYADPQNNIGTIYYERKKYPKAIRAYNKAISIKDNFAPFYLNLGYAYFAEKQYEESITAFRKALQLDPDAFEASKSRSGTVIQDRSISADRARFYFLLAKSFAEAGNAERCAIYLKKARDEGYQDMNAVNTDPSFTKVLKDPAVQEALAPKQGPEGAVQQ